MPSNKEKRLNAKYRYMYYFYKVSQIFEFTWSHIFTTRNAEDMESQSVEHL